jgi:hypothetical protein
MAITATASGTFLIGGDLEVTRLGYGAMRITGPGVWGPPPDRDGAIAVLKRLPEVGVDFIDTRTRTAVRLRGPDPRGAASL